VFLRILLDYVTWMIKPYLNGHITKQDPKTVDFRQFCEWFRYIQELQGLINQSTTPRERAFRQYVILYSLIYYTQIDS